MSNLTCYRIIYLEYTRGWQYREFKTSDSRAKFWIVPHVSFFSVLSFLICFLSNVGQSSYLMWYSSNLSDLLSFHTLYNITGVQMILLCCHCCSDGSARVSLVEYSSSLRTCSPRYPIIQYLKNPKKYPPKVFFVVFFSYSSSLRTCSPRYSIPFFCWYWAEVSLTV